MKITVEPSRGLSYDPRSGETRELDGMLIEWQEKLGGSRKRATILVKGASRPAELLRAAAAYFEAQDA